MASGVYGSVRPADVSPSDMEIFLHYSPSRDVIGDSNLTKLDPNQVLLPVENPNNETNVSEIFGGLYTLKLPSNIIGQKGIYTIIIKPLEIRTRIVDTGVLSSQPNTKGILFDISSLDSNIRNRFENNALVGYRIEYISTDNLINRKIPNLFRIITSNNKAEPVNQNLTNTSQKAIRYRFNDNSSLTFATITPSSASNVKTNVFPFIGEPNQEVIITNTFFNPVTVEIEMVEYDTESLAIGLFGNHSKSLEDGMYTIYNFNNEIFSQYNLFEIKDSVTGKPLFEVRERRSNIDFDKDFDIVSNV